MSLDHNYSAQEIVEIGRQAQAVLGSQVFGLAYQSVLDDLQRRFFDAEPGHTRTLEEIRREGNALARVVSNLQRAVVQAQQVLHSQDQGGSE